MREKKKKKENNEITVRANCSLEQLEKEIKDFGFVENNRYYFSDIFLIPNEIDILKENTRDILKKAVLLREGKGITTNKNSKKIVFKKKVINENGEIISQSAEKCRIEDIQDAKNLFLAIGYKELMKTMELHIAYIKDDTLLVVKDTKNLGIILEIETSKKYNTIDKLTQLLKSMNLSVDLTNLFVKKAEEELDKIKENMKN